MQETVAQAISRLLIARRNCERSGNTEWHARHTETIEGLVRWYLPSGSGWDCGTKMDMGSSTPDHLVLYGSYHHMNDGYYDGWTEHVIHVRPSLAFGIDLKVTGRDRNGVKDYLYDMFQEALTQIVKEG